MGAELTPTKLILEDQNAANRVSFNNASGIVSVTPAIDDTGAIHFGDGTTDLDVKIFLGSTSNYVLFDVGNSAITLVGVDFAFGDTVSFGSDGSGVDMYLYSTTEGDWVLWDASDKQLEFVDSNLVLGDTDLLKFGDLTAGDITMNFDSANFEIEGAAAATPVLIGADSKLLNITLKGTLTVGKTDVGHDVRLYGATAATYVEWDESANELKLGPAKANTKLSFYDSDVYISSPADGKITISANGAGADDITLSGGITFDSNLTLGSAKDILVAADTAASLEFYDSTTKFLVFDTRNTVTGITNALFTAMPSTITAASGVTKITVGIIPGTTTLTGSTGVTAMEGLGLHIAQPTVTDEDAVTVTDVSTIYIAAAPVGAGLGPATLTNAYALKIAAGNTVTAGRIIVDDTTNSTTSLTGSIQTDGGIGIALNLIVGADGTGADVKFHSVNEGRFILWDANGDTDGAFYFGADTEGILTQWYFLIPP